MSICRGYSLYQVSYFLLLLIDFILHNFIHKICNCIMLTIEIKTRTCVSVPDDTFRR
jgi:hypothetical protein